MRREDGGGERGRDRGSEREVGEGGEGGGGGGRGGGRRERGMCVRDRFGVGVCCSLIVSESSFCLFERLPGMLLSSIGSWAGGLFVYDCLAKER